MPAAAPARRAMDVVRSVAGRLRGRDTARNLYDVLGLPPGADEAQIKVAYRDLARRLHPDVNVTDAASSARLTEVNHAYEILNDQRARKAYDHALITQQAHLRRHYSLLAVCTGVTFAITLIAVSFLIRWHLQTAPRAELPPVIAGGETVTPPVAAPAVVGVDVGKVTEEAGWTTFHDPHFAFTLSYPAAVFSFDPAQSDANMHTFVSRDRRATFRIVASENTTGVTLARFRSTLIKKRYAGASFEQTPQRRYWFALAGTQGEEAFLERVTLSCDGKALHGWQMRYPLSQRAAYDDLAKVMLRNHLDAIEPMAACEDKSRRKARAR